MGVDATYLIDTGSKNGALALRARFEELNEQENPELDLYITKFYEDLPLSNFVTALSPCRYPPFKGEEPSDYHESILKELKLLREFVGDMPIYYTHDLGTLPGDLESQSAAEELIKRGIWMPVDEVFMLVAQDYIPKG